MSNLMIIDGNSLMHRAYHALPPMDNGKGVPTNAVYGFLNMLLKLIDDYKPLYLAVAFDTRAPTPRHIAYSEYKAGRKPTDEELRAQFPIIEQVLTAMSIAVIKKDGLEADDILGILSNKAAKDGVHSFIVTGDKDALQLTSDNTSIVLTKKGISQILLVTPQVLSDEYGLTPDQMIELKALMGDASDNIPGIKGVGEKTALKLLHEYKTLDGVLQNSTNIKGKLGEKVAAGESDARLSKMLATIVTDAPLDLGYLDCEFSTANLPNCKNILFDLKLRAIASRLEQYGSGTTVLKENITTITPEYTVIELKTASDLQEATQKITSQVAIFIGEESIELCDGKTLYTIALAKDLLSVGIQADEGVIALKGLFCSEVAKILNDAKQYMHLLHSFEISVLNLQFDTAVAAYLLDPSRSIYTLETLLADAQISASGAGGLYSLYTMQKEQMQKKELLKLYQEIELPLVSVLFSMEIAGFNVDKTVLQELAVKYDAKLSELTKEILEHAGENFNINSPKQLGVILFEKLNLPSGKRTQRGYSTDVQTLEAIEELHPIIGLILQYRKASKLKSTYIDGLLNLASDGGKIHTSFKQMVTTTGRISSTEPNLQNIPIRTEQGREIRRAFVPTKGNILVDADYSQIELRVLSHIAKDEAMAQSFKDNEDIHTKTAIEVFGTADMRSYAKAVNFGIVYGISDFGLAKQLGISREKAHEYIQAYLKRYTGVSAYMENSGVVAEKLGYVTTLYGRRRDIPELKSSNFNVRSFGKRAAMNAPIQGSAADIIKAAMISVFNALKDGGYKARLILQVHDELIIDTPIAEEQAVKELIRQCMQNVCTLDVPLIADVSSGINWMEAK